MNKKLLGCILISATVSCTKTEKKCTGGTGDPAGFHMGEYVLDTALQTDTAFTNRDIVFTANDNYPDISWKIGDDPRTFNDRTVRLKFLNPGNIQTSLTGQRLNKNCIYEPFSSSSNLVLLTDDGSIRSALTGKFLGYNTDAPSQKFTVSVSYWFGPDYPWWTNGAYSIDNLPNGYTDSTQSFNGVSRPEIRGIIASTGYKNMAFDKSGNIPAAGIKGYAMLKRGVPDTLFANYTIIDTIKLRETGQLLYLQKKFIGLKK